MVPFDKSYRVRGDDTFMLQLLLFTLLLSASAVGYVMLWNEPSPDCTPFRNLSSAWAVVEEAIDKGPTWVESVLVFVSQATFIVPLVILLL